MKGGGVESTPSPFLKILKKKKEKKQYDYALC